MALESSEGIRPTASLLEEHREDILRVAYRHGARNVRLFGSAARGESTALSDIDFLVDVEDQASPWFPAGLVDELETLRGRPVDVVTACRCCD